MFGLEAALIPFLAPYLPWLTYAWMWEKSVNIAIISTLIFQKPRNWCVDYDASGYDGIFYCL